MESNMAEGRGAAVTQSMLRAGVWAGPSISRSA